MRSATRRGTPRPLPCAVLREHHIGVGEAHVAHEVERVLLTAFGDAPHIRFRGGDTTRALPQKIERQVDRRFELLWSDGGSLLTPQETE